MHKSQYVCENDDTQSKTSKKASELRQATDKKYTKKELNIMARADKFKKHMSLQFKLSQLNMYNKG